MKKFLICMAVLTASVATIIGVNTNSKFDEYLEINVEALANIESDAPTQECYKRIVSDSIQKVFYCGECAWVYGSAAWLSGKSKCTPRNY